MAMTTMRPGPSASPLGAAIAAFAHRGARRGTAATFLVYSGLLAAGLLLLAAWLAPAARAGDLALLENTRASAWPPHVDPSLWTPLALGDVLACWVLALCGFVLAPAAVAVAVGHERRAGTLDQLRTTPLSPLGLASGFVVGVPARLYLLCVGPLGLHLLAGVAGAVPPGALVASLAVLFVGSAALSVLALCLALAPRQDAGGAFVALGVAALLGLGGLCACASVGDRHLVAWAFLHPAGAFDAALRAPHGLWRRMASGPWGDAFDQSRYLATLGLVPLESVAFALVFGATLLYAACRKLAAPERPLLSKRQAVLLFALAATVLVAPLHAADPTVSFGPAVACGFSALLLPVLLVVGVLSTPTFEAWAMARRAGRRPAWHDDDAAPHRALWLIEASWALAVLALGGRELVRELDGGGALVAAWGAWVALTLPVFLLFGATRYGGLAARWAFAVAVGAHLVCQLVALAIAADLVRDGRLQGVAGTFAALAAVAAVAVPAWVAWRQRVLGRALVPRGGRP